MSAKGDSPKTSDTNQVRKATASDRAGQCPISFSLDAFGDRWTLLILRDMIFKKKKHYGQFLKSPEKIATNILADRLLMLETEEIVTKTRDPAHKSRFVYGLTEKGCDIVPILLAMTNWSAKHNPQPNAPSSVIIGAPENLLQRYQDDAHSLVEEIVDRIDD